MRRFLFLQALVKFSVGAFFVGLLLFLPAGTLDWWKAWLLICLLFIPMFFAGLYLLKANPKLLWRRLNADEEQEEQKIVIVFAGIMFVAAFVAAGLNFRFGWIILPDWVTFVGAAIFLPSYALYAEVLRENEYLSRTVEVQEGQKVIDTGLYGIVRHPMYLASVLLFLSMPLVLGSAISFLIMLAYFPIIVKRIRNEEEVLEKGLPGYTEYKKKVPCRLIPFVW